VSPDGTRLLLDPGDRFWIGSTAGGSGRQTDPQGGGVPSQVIWVGNAHPAYITVSATPGPAIQPTVLARLHVLSLTGGPKLLASVRSRQ
jgi:hypothetical protein